MVSINVMSRTSFGFIAIVKIISMDRVMVRVRNSFQVRLSLGFELYLAFELCLALYFKV